MHDDEMKKKEAKKIVVLDQPLALGKGKAKASGSKQLTSGGLKKPGGSNSLFNKVRQEVVQK